MVDSQSDNLANPLDLLPHSTPVIDPSVSTTVNASQLSGDYQGRQIATKSPTGPLCQSTADEGSHDNTQQQVDDSHDKEMHQNITVPEPDPLMSDGLEQGYSISSSNGDVSDTSRVYVESRSSESSSQSTRLKRKRKRSVFSYISSEEDHSTKLNTTSKAKTKCAPLPPKKKRNIKKKAVKKHDGQVACTSDNETTSHRGSVSKTNSTTVYDNETEVKEGDSSLKLKLKAQVRYPGYSSDWSSASDSDSNKAVSNDVTISTQASKKQLRADGQYSAPSSVESAVSTSSWTSSERDDKDCETQLVQDNYQTMSSHVDFPALECTDHEPSNHGGTNISGPQTIGEHENPITEVRNNTQESLISTASNGDLSNKERSILPSSPSLPEGGPKVYTDPVGEDNCSLESTHLADGGNSSAVCTDPAGEDNCSHESSPVADGGNSSAVCTDPRVEDTHESTPLAPESVDLEVEPQMPESGSTASQSEVTFIPETQETVVDVDDATDSVVVGERSQSPVIPLQSDHKPEHQTSPRAHIHVHDQWADQLHQSTYSNSSNCTKTKTSTVLHVGPSVSDIDSHSMVSAASDAIDDQGRKLKRKRLLEKIKKRHSRHRYSDTGDSTSTTDSRRMGPCLRRKAKLSAKVFGTYYMKKHPFRQPLSGSNRTDESSTTNVGSTSGISRSDSEFIHPPSRKLLSLPRTKKSTKSKVVNDVTVSGGNKHCQVNEQLQARKPVDNLHSGRLSEDEHLNSITCMSKPKPREADSGVSSISEMAQSPTSGNNAQQNNRKHTMSRKLKTKKKVAREVIEISSDSESSDFEPPPFKKRRPRPNLSQRRKREPTLLDRMYIPTSNKELLSISSELDVEQYAKADKLKTMDKYISKKSGDSESKHDSRVHQTSTQSSEDTTAAAPIEVTAPASLQSEIFGPSNYGGSPVADEQGSGSSNEEKMHIIDSKSCKKLLGSALTKSHCAHGDGSESSASGGDVTGRSSMDERSHQLSSKRDGTHSSDSSSQTDSDNSQSEEDKSAVKNHDKEKSSPATVLLDHDKTSSSSYSSSDEDHNSVTKPPSTSQETACQASTVCTPLDKSSSKIIAVVTSVRQAEVGQDVDEGASVIPTLGTGKDSNTKVKRATRGGGHNQSPEKDISSSPQKEFRRKRSKLKAATSPKQWSEQPVATHKESERESSESDVEVDKTACVQRLTTTPPQPPLRSGVKRGLQKERLNLVQSRSMKPSPQKNFRSQTSSTLHRPPRFLFPRSNAKKNYSHQLSELKKPTAKPQGSAQSDSSIGKKEQ